MRARFSAEIARLKGLYNLDRAGALFRRAAVIAGHGESVAEYILTAALTRAAEDLRLNPIEVLEQARRRS